LNHQAVEDYLKTIYALEREARPVSTSRIAEARGVKPASATSMIQRLDKLGLVAYAKHYGVSLTDAGREIALEVIRHHRLVELYLTQALGFSWDEVHEQAEILEHVISEKLEERIAAALDYPQFDPHGDPIPTREGVIAALNTVALAGSAAGDRLLVAGIQDDSDSELLRYLAEYGLVPGRPVEVVSVAPFDGPFTLLVGGREVVVSQRVAEAIYVTGC
jgi:DtxR family Mn-dependent transcriptional regulator